MKFELRSIEYSARMSEETSAYAAKLYLDGKHIADVKNTGTGGCDMQYPAKGFTYAELQELDRKIGETFPRLPYGHGIEGDYRQSLETVCTDLLMRHLKIKDVRRLCRASILFLMPGDDAAKGFRTFSKKKFPEPKIRAHLAAKYEGATIINDMSDDEIAALAI